MADGVRDRIKSQATPAAPGLDDDLVPVDVMKFSSAPPPAKVDPYLGRTIDGRYVVEAVLGEGGMGVVYRGRHKVIDKKVAIKVLRGEMAKNKEITERFLQEAKAASSIGNPHIIDISDFGELPDGSTYFVMEHLAGKSLTDAMKEARPMPYPRLTHIAKQIAAGLSAAHDAGIVHRDLKPDNVMLINRGPDKDFVKILDFGIAKVGGEASRLTRAGSVFGTPHYMSPEQAAGTPVDMRTDIYALGVIMYEMASGKVPFDADNFMGILTQHMYKKPPFIRELVPMPDVPAGLDAIVQKCLTKKIEGRYVTMAALVADLEKLEKGLTPDALPEMMSRSGGFNVPADYFRQSAMPVPVPGVPAGVPSKGSPKLIAAVAAGALALVVIAGVVYNATTTKAQPQERSAQVAAVERGPAPPSVDTAPAIPPPPPVAASKQVLIGAEPPDSIVKRDGKVLDKTPFALNLADGEKATLVVSHAGYKDRTVVIDGSVSRLTISLDAVGGGRSAAHSGGAGAKGTPAPQSGGVDSLSDPWGSGKH